LEKALNRKAFRLTQDKAVHLHFFLVLD